MAIKINPREKGTLRAFLGAKAGKDIPTAALNRAANSSDPAIKKKAVFAKNARKWKH